MVVSRYCSICNIILRSADQIIAPPAGNSSITPYADLFSDNSADVFLILLNYDDLLSFRMFEI